MPAPAELGALARTARPLTLGPTERLVVQGQDGDRRERLDVRDARTTLAARIRSTLFAAR